MADLRYRMARNRADAYGQVFTPQAVADLLVRSLPVPVEGVTSLLDLGAGEGALSDAAQRKHPTARATLLEVDPELVIELNQNPRRNRCIVQMDLLNGHWQPSRPPSWILSNPPFGHMAVTDTLTCEVRQSSLGFEPEGTWLRRDVAFLVKAWKMAVRGTSLGFIVASPILCDPTYAGIRTTLAREMGELVVTQLPEKVFDRAQVCAHLISGRKAVARKRRVVLRKATAEGDIVDELVIDQIAARTSLDIDYHRTIERLGVDLSCMRDTLASSGALITRGSRSNADYKRLGLKAFHTTDLDVHGSDVHLKGGELTGHQIARSGDMLIARVGSRCIARQARVHGGAGPYTDSVYRLTVPERYRQRVWQTLSSSFGTEWRLAHAAGSCAKHLTVQTLASMPLLPA
ncbi:MAG: methyltransferase [Lysobacteraceae bacterium]